MRSLLDDCLGDVIATDGDCKEGTLKVQQMMMVYEKLGRPAKYAALVDTIVTQYHKHADSFSAKYLPFSNECLVVKAIGNQAADLQKMMLADAGAPQSGVQAPVGVEGALTKPLSALGDAASIGVFAAVGVGVYLLYHVGKR